VVAALVRLLSGLVIAATPWAIGAAKIVALLLAIVGVFMLLIPNRLTLACEWMIGPITWVNLWHALFLLWWKASQFLDRVYDTLVFSTAIPDGGLGAASVLQLLSATGYIAVAIFAYHIVFARAGGGAYLLAGAIGGTQRFMARAIKVGTRIVTMAPARAASASSTSGGPASPTSAGRTGAFPTNPPRGGSTP